MINDNETQDDLNSWDDFISGTFLKAENVESEKDPYVVVAIESVTQDDVKKPRLHLERNQKNWDFDLNKTNAAKTKEIGIKSPKELIGKKIYFEKVKVRNPKLNKEVDGLRILKIE